MTRTRATALALVNWRGVFYNRYELDRHVTALEGANGAGKTTVMIAAYIVLLPDMSRLRFTNLGESGVTGGDKGIWGRLGEPGRPSYAVLDLALDGKRRLVAGVHLERKGEPSIEPTPFTVSDLGTDVRLQDILLLREGDSDQVPELNELRENAARLGGRLKTFGSVRDYFAELFDQGVMPMRLSADGDRQKLNEMLRTSMTGGISRSLSSDLRSFLLKEEGGLADTLQRMQGNLEACRRTRHEVQEARRLEQEIGGVMEAGRKMFAAAYEAARARAEELGERVAEAEAAHAEALSAEVTARNAIAEADAEFEALELRRGGLAQALDETRSRLATLREARAALEDLERAAAALAEAGHAYGTANDACNGAMEERNRRREDLRRAEEGYMRASEGLADLQRGIEELHRRAGAYHQAVRMLREAETSLETHPIGEEEFAEQLNKARAELSETDQRRRDAATRLADADDHRERHAFAMTALSALLGHCVDAAEAHDAALSALRRYRELAVRAERLPGIEKDLEETRGLADRQSKARRSANRLGVAPGEGPAAHCVTELLRQAEELWAGHDAQAREARDEASGTRRLIDELEARSREFEANVPRWHDLAAKAGRIEGYLGIALVDRAGLDAARTALAQELTSARRIEEDIKNAHEQLMQEARDLLATGGPFPPEFLEIKDRLDAELLASSLEEVGLAEAAVIEARLGALAQALVVDDTEAAALAISDRPEAVSDVWLVPRDADLGRFTALTDVAMRGRDVLVEEGGALRITRIPEHPRLGRRAREDLAAVLAGKADETAGELEKACAVRRLLERLVADGEDLLAGHSIWLAGDPAREMAEVASRITEARGRIGHLLAAVEHHTEAARGLLPRIEGLRGLLAEAYLLDPPDHAARAVALEAEMIEIRKGRDWAASMRSHAEMLEQGLAVLRQAPLSEEGIQHLRMQVEALRTRRDGIDDGIRALEYVLANAEALHWEDAPRRLAGEEALIPALKAQLSEARACRDAAEKGACDADARHDEAVRHLHEMDARLRLARREHEAAAERFTRLGVSEPSEDAINKAASEAEQLDQEVASLNTRRDQLLTIRGARENALKEAQSRVKEANERLAVTRRDAEPAMRRWDALRERAAGLGLLGGWIVDGGSGGIRGSVNLQFEASTQREILLERLRGAQGGRALLSELETNRETPDAAHADPYLELWQRVRDWLLRRLPAQVAEVDDPGEALARLRDRLAVVEERLSRQEVDLRGASEDVARSIDVQIRKARGQVTRLNKGLDGTGFGGIQGIRVRMEPVERMDQVLRALREGAVQCLLFQAEIPIEEALEEIFRRHGGGRTGGERLLDYREYIRLQVEIRRKGASDWEVANPTRLSTGEAIGVGAALMMVILTEWERDSTLLRGKRTSGSLRFLFLDEANRLSQDNLAVLFDLCQTLDLQLLIAAPEVACTEGNTTYHLARRITEDGRETVLVTGRRARVRR